jgi:hypothetical protein
MWHVPRFTSLVTALCQPALRTCGRGLRGDPGSGLFVMFSPPWFAGIYRIGKEAKSNALASPPKLLKLRLI